MWWSRSPSKTEPRSDAKPSSPPGNGKKVSPVAPAESGRSEDESDAALDTVAALLRASVRFPIDIEGGEAPDNTQLFEDWARHVLLRTPRPGNDMPPEGHKVRREWGALRAWYLNHRKSEAGFVARSITDLREAVWAFVRSFSKAVSEDGEGDAQMQVHIARLNKVVSLNSPEEIKREVLLAAASIGEVLEDRKQRQRLQVGELGERLRSLGRQLEEAKREGATDPLTRLFNRKAFDEYMARTLDMAWLFDQNACLLLVDVDHFKRVNDTYGHPCGDQVLRQLSDCISRTFLRKSDFVARYGGEEFGVILGDTSVKDSLSLAERLRASIAKMRVDHQGTTVQITVSIGIANVQMGESPEQWLSRADRALYAAKHAGRNRVMSHGDVPVDFAPPADRSLVACNSARPTVGG